MDPKLKMLCELYDRSDENVSVNALLKVCFFKNLEEVLYLLSKIQCIKFAYLCAKSVLYLNDEETKEKAKKCLKLVEKWLENPGDVSNDELIKTANSFHPTYSAAYAAAYAATYSAAYAATYSAAYAAAFHAVYYVNAAADAAGYASHAVENKQEQEYKNLSFLVKVIKDEP